MFAQHHHCISEYVTLYQKLQVSNSEDEDIGHDK